MKNTSIGAERLILILLLQTQIPALSRGTNRKQRWWNWRINERDGAISDTATLAGGGGGGVCCVFFSARCGKWGCLSWVTARWTAMVPLRSPCWHFRRWFPHFLSVRPLFPPTLLTSSLLFSAAVRGPVVTQRYFDWMMSVRPHVQSQICGKTVSYSEQSRSKANTLGGVSVGGRTSRGLTLTSTFISLCSSRRTGRNLWVWFL